MLAPWRMHTCNRNHLRCQKHQDTWQSRIISKLIREFMHLWSVWLWNIINVYRYGHIYTHAHLYLFERVQSLTNEEAWINEKVLGQSWFENCTLKLQKLWATSVKTVWRCRAAYCRAKAQNFCFLADCRFFFWMFKWDPPQVNTTAVSDACLIFEARARMFVTALYCWSCVTAHLYVYWNTKVQFQSAKSSLDAFHIFP